jgi:hypothetical protein
MAVKEDVLKIMKKESRPLRPGELVEMCGVDKKTLDKIIKELKEEDKIFSPIRCFWQAK